MAQELVLLILKDPDYPSLLAHSLPSLGTADLPCLVLLDNHRASYQDQLPSDRQKPEGSLSLCFKVNPFSRGQTLDGCQ